MRISVNDKLLSRSRRQEGFTLLELLITLSIVSLGAVIAGNALNKRLPQRTVDLTAEQLLGDLKRARMEAQRSGAAVTIRLTKTSYDIAETRTKRTLPRNLTMTLSGQDQETITFSTAFAHMGGDIALAKGNSRALIRVHPITGKVERIE